MDVKKMTDNSSKCLRERDPWMLHLVTTPASFSVTTAWSPSFKNPPGELSVYRGKSGEKGSPYSSLLIFFQHPVQP